MRWLWYIPWTLTRVIVLCMGVFGAVLWYLGSSMCDLDDWLGRRVHEIPRLDEEETS